MKSLQAYWRYNQNTGLATLIQHEDYPGNLLRGADLRDADLRDTYLLTAAFHGLTLVALT
jgi:uncharacterized protein YjbI with pentapeptide repeats